MSDFSFGPEFRLHYPWEYRRFFQNSQVIRLPECILFRIPNQYGHFRLGLTVKARVNSVQRNQIRRTLREAFRHHKADLGAFDYNVVIPSSKKVDHLYIKRLRACLGRELPRVQKVI